MRKRMRQLCRVLAMTLALCLAFPLEATAATIDEVKARQEELPLPAGLIGISAWTDLTASGRSYAENRDRDPSMTWERLDFFASCYTQCRDLPLVSPLFGDLTGFPPSLLFVGGDEIMLDDSRLLHEKLMASGSPSTLVVAPGLWHAYILYVLKERREDLERIAAFCRDCCRGQK